jgi:uncharacterized OB-fold protein
MPSLSCAGEYRGPALVVHPETESFWRNLGQGELTLPKCSSCGLIRFPIAPVCYRCGSLAYDWVAVPGDGRVNVAVEMKRATGNPIWNGEVPFITGQIDMADGRRLPGRVLCDCGEATKHGESVTAAYLSADGGYGVLCFLHGCRQ